MTFEVLKQGMKKFLGRLFFVFLISVLHFSPMRIFAKDNEPTKIENELNQQIKNFGINEFYENFSSELPKESEDFLKKFKANNGFKHFIDSHSKNENFDFHNIYEVISEILRQKFNTPFKSFAPIVGAMLLYALVANIGYSSKKNELQSVLNSIVTACICLNVIEPLVNFSARISLIIRCAASFILCYVPICSGIMIANGQPVTATFYHAAMIAVGQVISLISSEFLIPIVNSMLGLSTISALSEKLPLARICKLMQKTIVWILRFLVTIFVGILGLQSLITSGLDGFNSKMVKFALVNFIPIIGSPLSESFMAFQGGIRLLKTSFGSFGILIGCTIFIPTIIECAIWILFLNIGSVISDTFQLEASTIFFNSISKIMEVIFAIILSTMLILTVSTAIMMAIHN